MQPVLDGPVAARQLQQPFGTGLGGGEAGDDIGGLRAGLSACLAGAFDAGNLGGAGPRQVRDDLGAGCDLARLDAAVLFVNGFCRLQIGRQNGGAGGGKALRSFRQGWL